MPKVFIPPSMRPLTGDTPIIEIEGSNLGQVINNLERRYPGFKERICQDDAIRPGIAIAIGDSVATLGLYQRTDPDVEIHFLPAVGGG